jgi:hypothetical protein
VALLLGLDLTDQKRFHPSRETVSLYISYCSAFHLIYEATVYTTSVCCQPVQSSEKDSNFSLVIRQTKPPSDGNRNFSLCCFIIVIISHNDIESEN